MRYIDFLFIPMIIIVGFNLASQHNIEKRKIRKEKNDDKYYIKYNEIYYEIKEKSYAMNTKIKMVRELEYKEKVYTDSINSSPMKFIDSIAVLSLSLAFFSILVSSAFSVMNSSNSETTKYNMLILDVISALSYMPFTYFCVIVIRNAVSNNFTKNKLKIIYEKLRDTQLRINILKDILLEEDNIVL